MKTHCVGSFNVKKILKLVTNKHAVKLNYCGNVGAGIVSDRFDIAPNKHLREACELPSNSAARAGTFGLTS